LKVYTHAESGSEKNYHVGNASLWFKLTLKHS